jgi:hypothetical protein
MATYYAVVSFTVLDFVAETKELAEKIVNELIDDLSDVDTAVGWDNVEFDVIENKQEEDK